MSDSNETVLLTAKLSATASCFQCQSPLFGTRCGRCGAAAVAGRWRTLRVLSQKNWSRVYQAQDEAGTQVALKELLFSEVPGAAALDAFTREAEILRKVSHPNVPRLLDSFQEGTGAGTRLYMAYELVPGRSLASLLETHTFQEKDARGLAQQVLTILTYLHGLSPRIIHRDIKPANVIVRADKTVALVDFGTARGVVDLTLSSTFGGTFGYAPIEQQGGTVDVTTDLYALGATIVHLMTGLPPDKRLGKDFSLNLDGINMTPGFRAFLEGLVARDPKDRYGSAEAALKALRDPTLPAPPAGRVNRAVVGVSLAAGAALLLWAIQALWPH